jgi:hypothetical protein
MVVWVFHMILIWIQKQKYIDKLPRCVDLNQALVVSINENYSC